MRVVRDDSDNATNPTIVLVHGSGHTSGAWGAVQSHLRHGSVAVDLPGRVDRVADIADVTLEAAAVSLAADVDAQTDGPLVLVGHSAGGIVLPGLAARLVERVQHVQHLVFVAGLSAPHGETVMATVRPDAAELLATRLAAMRAEFAGCMLEPD
ncbi:MAG TPA: alpha/beta fold hydrolase, partial [Gaiellaceae bacterium]|nr:alpha/beta fold hydrolase [Gaiellaceae bacterium]